MANAKGTKVFVMDTKNIYKQVMNIANETAKANDIEPYAYLVDVLTRLPYADTVEKLEELLPWNLTSEQVTVL